MATSHKRVSKTITSKEDIDFLLSLREKDITSSMVMELFGEFEGKRRFQPFDIITIPIGRYGGKIPNDKTKFNKKAITTTVGRLIFNKYFIEDTPELLDIIGYRNVSLSKKEYGSIFDELGYMLLEDRISIKTYKDFQSKTQKFMPYVSILAYNHSDAMLTVSTKINKKKEELKAKYAKEIAENDIHVVDKISNELMDYAKELLKDDPSMDMFMSGAGGTFGNNFKNIYIMRGSVKDPDPTKDYNIIFSNFADGINREDYHKIANTLAAGPYSRTNKTKLGVA